MPQCGEGESAVRASSVFFGLQDRLFVPTAGPPCKRGPLHLQRNYRWGDGGLWTRDWDLELQTQDAGQSDGGGGELVVGIQESGANVGDAQS
jgi:hypothetical protein